MEPVRPSSSDNLHFFFIFGAYQCDFDKVLIGVFSIEKMQTVCLWLVRKIPALNSDCSSVSQNRSFMWKIM